MEAMTLRKQGSAVIVALSGEITLEISSELKKTLDPALDGGNFTNLVVDLSSVTFMDSSGIGFLVALNTKIMGAGNTMYLLKPSEQVRKTFELVQLNTFFKILDTDEELEALLTE